ncbi:hypothetical protein TgHK011_000332 [Trichoderma gracile]|nr:hypothetical protein TgHK011_000332 [Trichoderma gracile]
MQLYWFSKQCSFPELKLRCIAILGRQHHPKILNYKGSSTAMSFHQKPIQTTETLSAKQHHHISTKQPQCSPLSPPPPSSSPSPSSPTPPPSTPSSPPGLLPTESCSLQGTDSGVNSTDLQALAVALKQNTLTTGPVDDSILIKASHAVQFAAGTAAACVQNNFLFENAHFARSDIADAIAKSFIDCCDGTDFCNNKPFSTISGDTGLTAIVQIQNPGEECKSPNGGASGKLEDAEIIGKTAKFFADLFSAFRG